ncbi:MAG TPA: chemotaxis protein, partial [Paraburkholderia sp.]
MPEPVLNEDQRDALQEVANLAMGQAAKRLALLLD